MVKKSDEKENISIRLPKGLHKEMKSLALAQEKPVSDLYEKAVKVFLKTK